MMKNQSSCTTFTCTLSQMHNYALTLDPTGSIIFQCHCLYRVGGPIGSISGGKWVPSKPSTVAQCLHVHGLSWIAVRQYLSFTNSHYSLIQQDQPTACTGWGWGGRLLDKYLGKVGAKRASDRTVAFSKVYQQARNLQLHFRNAHGKIDHTQYTYVQQR